LKKDWDKGIVDTGVFRGKRKKNKHCDSMAELDSEIDKEKQEYINTLNTDFGYSIDKFDTQALYLSSGALAISLTFIKDIVPINEARWLILYYVSLILFGITIIIGFVAHYISSRRIMSKIKKAYKNDFSDEDDKCISFLNKAVIGTLLLGISSLIIFTIINMNIASKKSKQHIDNSIIIEKTLSDSTMIKIFGDVKNCNYIDKDNYIKK